MRKSLFALLSVLVIASVVLAACGGGAAPAPAPAEQATEAAAAATEEATEAAEVTEAAAEAATEAPTEAATEAPTEVAIMPDRTQVRWFVGLGTGTDPAQQAIQQEVVDEFNNSQDKIQLILEVVPYAASRDTLSTQIASGNGPDIVGPVGVGGSNAFYGQWLDLTDQITKTNYDLTQFNDAMVKFYQTEEGQVGLPFAVYPSMMFFQKAMFDEAGLAYPPTKYGEKYVMPDGTEVDWSWDTVTELAKILTVDAAGNDATMPEFDKTKIVQYGYVPQYQNPAHVGAFFGAGKLAADDGKTAQIPEAWDTAWKWWYDGMWGDQPFIPTDPVVQSPEFGAGNPFNGGKVAMAVTHAWYTCCIAAAGEDWELGILPSNGGTVNGRVDADTYRVWKGTKNPDATFEVLSYLIGPASLKLLETYGGMPARTADQQAYFDTKAKQFPWVQNWPILTEGLNYPDNPSAEGYTPNWNEMWDRLAKFQSTLQTTAGLDMDKEIATLKTDLQAIYDKAAQ